MEEMYGFGPGELNGKPTAATYADEADYAEAEKGYAEIGRASCRERVWRYV